MTLSLRTRRSALFALFALPGITIASWVTRTPEIRDLVGASTAEMGFILFGLSAGSMLGILSSGTLVSRFDTRPVILYATVSIAAGALVIGAGAATANGVIVAVGLGLFGLGVGGGEIALNIEGAEVERGLGVSTLPAMHGAFSLGTVIGALLGMLFTVVGLPVQLHLGIIAIAVVLVLAFAIRRVPTRTRTPKMPGDATRTTKVSRRALWADRRLLLVGLVILALALAEGSANDWLPLIMVDGHGFDPALGSGVYVAFATAMTVGRLLGGRLVDRFGRPAVLGGSAIVGAVGLVLVIFVDNQIAAAAAAVIWGLGASLGFPVALSAAGDSGDSAAPAEEAEARVAIAATIGYVAFLVGPPVLGVLGEQVGLRNALVLVLALVVVAAACTPMLARRREPTEADRHLAKG